MRKNKTFTFWLTGGLLLLIIAGLQISASAYTVLDPGDFWLKAFNQDADNYIYLEWEDVGSDYFYTLYQSEDNMANWQSRSANYGKDITVLNIYPDRSGSDQLKTWMEDEDFGIGHISVTKVALSTYNSDPDFFLKNNQGNFQYDVIAFGFWDANNFLDLSDPATAATEAFIESGRGLLMGHDTATLASNVYNENFASLMEKYCQIEVLDATDPANNGIAMSLGSAVIKSINDGFLLQYPWSITYGEELDVPPSHSTRQIAGGIIWMEYVPPFTTYPGPEYVTESGGTNNFYLTTWNNTAMIQTGHANGDATDDEKMILANTLMYLAQYTEATDAHDYSASDQAGPGLPAVSLGTTVKDVSISAEDFGTPYWYRVEAVNKSDISEVLKSDTVLEYCTSGIKGYYIIEDGNDYTDFDETEAALHIAAADGTLAYTWADITKYLHIKAVDHAGNTGPAICISPYDAGFSFQIKKELDGIAGQDQSFVFAVEYKSESTAPAKHIFYGVVTVPEGSQSAAVDYDSILPGIYTITETDSNWLYQIDAATPASQEVTLLDPLNPSDSAAFINNGGSVNWIYGQADAINQLDPLPTD